MKNWKPCIWKRWERLPALNPHLRVPLSSDARRLQPVIPRFGFPKCSLLLSLTQEVYQSIGESSRILR